MIVKELIEYLKEMPETAQVVSGKTVPGAWTILSRPRLTKYRNLDVCVIIEGYR